MGGQFRLGLSVPGTTSVTISGMSAGTTYEFAVVAYNSTSQTASAWTALTTIASANTGSRPAFDDGDDASIPVLDVDVTLNQATVIGSAVNQLALSVADATVATNSRSQAMPRAADHRGPDVDFAGWRLVQSNGWL